MATDSTTPAKPATRRTPRAKKQVATDATVAPEKAVTETAVPAAPASDKVVASSDPVAAKTLKKRELLDRVAKAANVRPGDAKAVFEATLGELGAAFAAGETLSAPPFGKARVNRQKDIDGGEVIILKLRRKAVEMSEADD